MPLDEGQFSIIEKTINLIEKHGILRILKALFVLVAFIYVMYNGQNVNSIIENAFRQQATEHEMALDYRRKIDPEIKLMLTDLLYKTSANRAFIIEMHNGNSNVSGLPFLYGEMTYEEVTSGVVHIDEDYRNVNLSRFSFANYIDENHFWKGTIDELATIDSKLSMRMKSNDAYYAIFVCIHGVDNPIGFLGITYCHDKQPSNLERIMGDVYVLSQKLSQLLDMKRANIYQ